MYQNWVCGLQVCYCSSSLEKNKNMSIVGDKTLQLQT